MSVFSVDTVVTFFKCTIFNPLLSIAILISTGCEVYTCKSSNLYLQRTIHLLQDLVPAAFQKSWPSAAVAALVLLGWWLSLSSHLWYNRVYLSPIRKKDWPHELVVITGGASGIGYNTAVRLAANGAKVVIIDIEKLPALNAQTSSTNLTEALARQNISAYICDISNEDAFAKVLKSTLAIHGVPSVVINNAGLTHSLPITSLSTPQLSRLINVNLTSHLWMLQHLLPSMIQRAKNEGRPGHIFSMASVMGHTGVSQMIDYCASKHGVVGLHKALRYELDYCHRCPQIRTSLLVLGHVKTQLFEGFRVNSIARFLGPSVEPDAVANRIVASIQQRRGGTIALPWYANWSELFALLPSWATDFAHWLLGSNTSMDDMMKSRSKSA
ncbi:related to a retinal short-chain dehydrogenase/reductase [Melanopsichium pennsylvanicum]|uniref:Related to a retinal short-chain dehydrogenase/reductase n=2 Tax=Melanopsichium pennsylvanicum TaxID=63383 RepID=A0AAJ5C284_9BASI|nr:related to a retinal short-chain dehydrogenase/reductase [Melanopsichium pennsylvanicum 4]SNX81298.1 related to a retinal short-chain dehydrogenase/reductase [Melanopsichium pennsylvanicum]